MITREQCRAARALIEWSQQHLAKQAGVGFSTVRDFEKGRHVPRPDNLEAIKSVLELGGVMFIAETDETGPGVCLVKTIRE